MVLDMLIVYFCKIGMQPKDEMYPEEIAEMPVMWHQTLLTLVQCYKVYFSPDQRKKIQALIKVQNHYAITPEIRREMSS